MSKLIIDGNAVYELDEECLKKKYSSKNNTESDKKKKPGSNPGKKK